jgi:hypothetical protein
MLAKAALEGCNLLRRLSDDGKFTEALHDFDNLQIYDLRDCFATLKDTRRFAEFLALEKKILQRAGVHEDAISQIMLELELPSLTVGILDEPTSGNFPFDVIKRAWKP